MEQLQNITNKLLKTLLLLAISLSFTAHAAPLTDYNEKAFNEAKAGQKTILLDFHADWCGTCKKQNKALTQVLKEKEFNNTVAFKVNYDNAKELKKQYGIKMQSTLVVIKGDKTFKAMGITDKKAIRDHLRQGL